MLGRWRPRAVHLEPRLRRARTVGTRRHGSKRACGRAGTAAGGFMTSWPASCDRSDYPPTGLRWETLPRRRRRRTLPTHPGRP
eukprot:1725419-Prymnesium_polylepis.2